MNTPKPLPPIELLRLLLDYNPETGVLTWRVSRGGKKPGDRAGTINRNGYRAISIQNDGKGKLYKASRLAWAHYNGEDPGLMVVDHINRVRDDNRICNLRLLTHGNNTRSRPYHVGISGEQHITITKWGKFKVNVRGIHIAHTPTLDEAVRLRDEYIRTTPGVL